MDLLFGRPVSRIFRQRAGQTRAHLFVAFALLAAASCPAAVPEPLVVESIHGPVTAAEIAAFKRHIARVNPAPNGWTPRHNEYAFGPTGRLIDAMGMMYEISGDVAILDRMLAFSDVVLSARNDLLSAAEGGQRVMWTGAVEKLWCPESPTHVRAQYSASEGGDPVARLAYTAKLILQNRDLWTRTVPDGNPKGYGATYRERADTYLRLCDETCADYFLRWFVTPDNLLRWPTDEKWTSPMRGGNVPGGAVPFNQQAMFTGGFIRLAECHEILGDNPELVRRYDAIVQASLDEFRNNLISYKNSSGATVYKWHYNINRRGSIESLGHAAYDILGIFRGYQRRGSYGMSSSVLRPFADTLSTVIYKEGDGFATFIDGSGSTQKGILGEWLLVGEWNATAYEIMASANVAAGTYKNNAHITAAMLWLKHRRAEGGAKRSPPLTSP